MTELLPPEPLKLAKFGRQRQKFHLLFVFFPIPGLPGFGYLHSSFCWPSWFPNWPPINQPWPRQGVRDQQRPAISSGRCTGERPTHESQPVTFHWSWNCHETIINCLIVINSDTCQAKAVKNVMLSRSFACLPTAGLSWRIPRAVSLWPSGLTRCAMEPLSCRIEVWAESGGTHEAINQWSLSKTGMVSLCELFFEKQIWWNYEIKWNPLNGPLIFFRRCVVQSTNSCRMGVGFSSCWVHPVVPPMF